MDEIRKFWKPLQNELLIGKERDQGQGKINDYPNRRKEKMRFEATGDFKKVRFQSNLGSGKEPSQ